MMAEPTLGQRILDAAHAYAAAISEQVVALSRGTWEVAHADAVTDANDRLRALCARADAAERLAVAGDVYWSAIEAYDTSENEDDWDELLAGMKSRRVQLDNALAAWRAINGEVE